MISFEQLSHARGLLRVAELFRGLGYPVELHECDREWFRHDEVRFELAESWKLYYGCRIGRFDLFLIDADVAASREACRDFLNRYRRWNVLARTAIVAVDSNGFALHGLDSRGRIRRLEVDANRPAGDGVERLNRLQRDARADREVPDLFEAVLERESLSRRFFQHFRSAVASISEEISAQCPDRGEAVAAQALLILSRLLFLCFLQQKGWLDGNPRFLADHLAAALREDRNFFATVLQPLFFGCLNTPEKDRDAGARGLGRIPYLNGGLFEASSFEQRHSRYSLSNVLLQQVVKEVFEHYSFSVDEGDEEGVHIDPEMLGKVFENLMASEERLSSGSFYTPKDIVDTLSREAIMHWCAGGDPDLLEQIEGGEPPHRDQALQLLRRLETVTVLDPACGSGAFLLAAGQVIESLTRRFAAAAGVAVPANLRQRIVERSLFGVDLKPEAVRLCELRLWLSIVSASEATAETVQPLPNLDRNILQGNALLGPLDFLGSARADIYRRWSFALRGRAELLERYRHSSPAERPALCRQIHESDQTLGVALLGSAVRADREDLERLRAPVAGLFGTPAPAPKGVRQPRIEQRLAATEKHLARAQEGVVDFFSFDLHFAHVFAGGGFNVVVGNPPWVRSSRLEPEQRNSLADRYRLFGAAGSFDQSDLCLAFFEKAFEVTTAGGVVAMLLPAKVATATYARALRRFVANSAQIVSIRDWTAEARDLFDADTFPLAMVTRKAAPEAARRVQIRCGTEEFSNLQREICGPGAGSPWRLAPPGVIGLVRRMEGRFPALAQVLQRRPLMGIKTGANERFFLCDAEPRNGGIYVPSLRMQLPATAVARCIRGRDVERWHTKSAWWMLLPPRNGGRPPAWVQRVCDAQGFQPEDFRLTYVQPEHFAIKVVWKDLSRGLQAVVVPATTTVNGREYPVVPNQTLYLFEAGTMQEAFTLSAILNSTIFNALVALVADPAKDAHFRYFGKTVADIPVPPIDFSSNEGRTLAALARKAHRGVDVAAELDESVRDLYEISAREFRILEAFLRRRLARS